MAKGPPSEGPLQEEVGQAVHLSGVAQRQWEPLQGETPQKEAVPEEHSHTPSWYAVSPGPGTG